LNETQIVRGPSNLDKEKNKQNLGGDINSDLSTVILVA
jgi:hypothetical protein